MSKTSVPAYGPTYGRAYELGRLRWAVSRAVVVAAAVVPAVVAGASVGSACLLGLTLVVATAFAGWRSRAGLLGAFAGVGVAAVPLVVGPLIAGTCLCTGGLCLSLCSLGCGAAAVVVGVVGGVAFARLSSHRFDFVAAAVVCGAAGMVLCPVVGVGSVVGAVAGAVVGVAPVLVLRRALA